MGEGLGFGLTGKLGCAWVLHGCWCMGAWLVGDVPIRPNPNPALANLAISELHYTSAKERKKERKNERKKERKRQYFSKTEETVA